jgi:hypothetical protein
MNTYLRSAREAIDDATDGLTPAAIGRAVEGRWSIGEILEHLTLAFRANAAALEKVLASGELRARRPSITQRLGRIVVTDFGYFPRVEAPETTRPTRAIPADRAVSEIRDALDRLDGTLARIAARFGEDAPVSNHPYFAGMTVHYWRKFHWRHTVHHMAQVLKLRKTPV